MLEDDLLAKLKEHGYTPQTCHTDIMGTTVLFHDTQEARLFAGTLMTWGIPRLYINNLINGKVIFQPSFLQRIVGIL